MLKISKMADYAIVIMSHLAREPDQQASAAEVAASTQIGLATVSSLLKILTDQQLVISQRGVNGGYRLARQPTEINIAEVIAAVEGPLAMTECNHLHNHCRHEAVCGTRENWQLINQVISSALATLSVADMTRSLRNHPLITQQLAYPTRR